jgi:CubicO group peptidase (beta-lactamase class C family)
MVDIHGICSGTFSGVREVFGRHLDTGADIGASVAVFIGGEPVVDIWGGCFDEARTRPWERDTLVNMFSTTKTMTALCALILADRGALDLHAPVTRYWPEFAAEGKARIEVRHFLGHTSGAGCERVFELQANGTDLVLGFALRWGMGYALGGPIVNNLYGNRFAGRRIAFWGSSGGSFVINDLDARMTVAYVMNRHVEHGSTDPRSIDIVNAAHDALMSR